MTRKHFEAVASRILAQINASESSYATDLLSELAESLANDFAAFNPAFDRARFLAACGIQ